MSIVSLNPNQYRYERKFFASSISPEEVEEIISFHPSLFKESFPPRFVNNIYLDSVNQRSYYDSINGYPNRVKVRIRWYGQLCGLIEKPILELKIKNGLVGTKISHLLKPFSIDDRLTLGVVRDVIGASNLPDGLKLELKGWNFALLNRYQRKYFLSENKAYRLTIDMMLEFFRLHPLHNRFLNASKDTLSTIIELKYPIDKDEGADSISKHLPFRVAKNSKFVSGFERINNFFNPNN